MISKVYVVVKWNLNLSGSKYDDRIRALRSSDEWELTRLELWKKFTVPSLCRQRHTDFDVLVMCDPKETEQNERLARTFPDPRFHVVSEWKKFRETISRIGLPGEKVLFCRIDSDDMYHRNTIHNFIEAIPEAWVVDRRYIQAMSGYCLIVETGKIHRWNNPTPPFFCAIRTRAELRREFPAGPGIVNHSTLASDSYHLKDEPLFCVTVNGSNICNRTSVAWIGEEIHGAEEFKVRKDYGISFDNSGV